MSNLVSADALPCQAQAADACFEALPTRDAELGGGLTIRRAPAPAGRRLVFSGSLRPPATGAERHRHARRPASAHRSANSQLAV